MRMMKKETKWSRALQRLFVPMMLSAAMLAGMLPAGMPLPVSAAAATSASSAWDGGPEAILQTSGDPESLTSRGSGGTTAVDGAADSNMRGLWIASVLNIDYPSKPTTDAAVLKQEADKALDYAASIGCNAVFLQIRPTADSLYPSKIFPWSRYLTGSQGTAPSDGFDPLSYWIAGAHSRGLELHAWVNPYRITKKTQAEAYPTVSMLAQTSPARLHPDWVVTHTDGNLYFNPGLPEVRLMLLNSIQEILDNYAVDGIHFDDYFYPGASFNDAATYATYGAGYADIQSWRRGNVDKLVKAVSELVHRYDGVRFGISPFGIWRNKASSADGSDTSGSESYSDHYADSVNWVKQGWLDYICPQIYWSIGYSVADYRKLALWWANVVKNTGVELYIGQAAYRTDSDDSTSPWYGVSEMGSQLSLNDSIPEVSGSVFYNYNTLVKRPGVAAVVKAWFERMDLAAAGGTAALSALKPLTVGRPSASLSTTYEGYYLNGASDPSKPLYLNGTLVESRSSKGYFGVFVPLASGKNTFVFSQEGTYAARSIYRKSSASSAAAMSKAEIVSGSAWPQSLVRLAPGETVKLSCRAPVGAKVTVKVNGQTLSMSPATSTASGLVATTYSVSWKLPAPTGAARVVDLGKPVYAMTYGKTTATATAPASVGVVMSGAPYVAEMKADTPIYNDASTDGGTRHTLPAASKEVVTSVQSGYAKLVSGYYVKTDAVTLSTPASLTLGNATKPVYTVGSAKDTITFVTSQVTAATIGCDGTKLTLSLPLSKSGTVLQLPSGALFKSAVVDKSGSTLRYVLTLKDGARLDGFMLDNVKNTLTVTLKRHVKGVGGSMPLTGKTILLDPGHGGTGSDGDPGAIGPMGTEWSEKNINLANAKAIRAALEARGATVVMTRDTDVALSLEQRLAICRKTQPDLFISVHADSMGDNVDISKISGFSVFYRETIAKGFADKVRSSIIGTLERKDRGVNQKNFYVIRGTWTPSVLIEAGFVPNPSEFEWMTDETQQKRLAESMANAAVAWFAE